MSQQVLFYTDSGVNLCKFSVPIEEVPRPGDFVKFGDKTYIVESKTWNYAKWPHLSIEVKRVEESNSQDTVRTFRDALNKLLDD